MLKDKVSNHDPSISIPAIYGGKGSYVYSMVKMDAIGHTQRKMEATSHECFIFQQFSDTSVYD